MIIPGFLLGILIFLGIGIVAIEAYIAYFIITLFGYTISYKLVFLIILLINLFIPRGQSKK